MAARAAGTSLPVRADARLPYAAGASGWSEIGEAEAHPRAAAPAGSQLPAAPVAHQSHRPTLHAETVEPRALVESTRAPSPAALTGTVVLRDPFPRTEGVPNDSGTDKSTQIVSGELVPTDEVHVSTPPMHTSPNRPPTAFASIEAQPAARVPPHEAAASARTATQFDEPAPLMPRKARPAPLSPMAQPSARRIARSQGASSTNATNGEDSTEVHIHIGRIDVTAGQEAPPPRRRAAAPPPPMSLEGYLTQRGRS